MLKVDRPVNWGTGERITLIASTEYGTILFGMEGGGLGADGLTFWDLNNGEIVFVSSWISTMEKWCLSPHLLLAA